MKWSNVAILILDKMDSTIESTVLACLRKYPQSLLVSKYELNTSCTLAHVEIATANILASCLTISSKMIIVGHGAPNSCARYYPDRLAFFLRYLGVKNVGLISFKACHIGSAFFLENFAFECTKRGIQLGWCLGYKGTMYPFRGHLIIGELPLDLLLRFASCDWLKLPDALRIKVVRGSAVLPASFGATRGRRFTTD